MCCCAAVLCVLSSSTHLAGCTASKFGGLLDGTIAWLAAEVAQVSIARANNCPSIAGTHTYGTKIYHIMRLLKAFNT